MSDPLVTMGIFALAATAFGLAGAILPHIVGPRNPGWEKERPYECGVVAPGDPWREFRVQFYVFALVFVIFDIEALFLFPWAVVFREAGTLGFVEVMLFIFILLLGWGFAWRMRALEWD